MSKNAIIIGSGIAGLATAIRLKAKNYDVSVFEANESPGGKLSRLESNGYTFDAGPSLFTLPSLVDELFEISGEKPDENFKYYKKNIHCQYFFNDGTKFTAWDDQDKFINEITEVFKINAKSVLEYLDKSKRKYELTSPLFLERSLHKVNSFLNFNTLKAIASANNLDLFDTLDEVNRHHFKDPRLVQLFNRYATYNGSSPYKTPGIMSMIPHLEFNVGTFYPEGGMYSITDSLYALAKKKGVKFNFNSPVDRIICKNGVVEGIITKNEEHSADLVVSNMDIVPTYRKLMPDQKAPEKTLSQERSSSALIYYWGIRKQFPELDLHNIFFSGNYKKEFTDIFDHKKVPDDPTIYINITSKEDPEHAPEGCENWFVMVNVPPNSGQNWDEMISITKKRIISRLNKFLDADIEKLIETEEMLTPITIESKTSSYMGALYGAGSNDRNAAFLRHPNFSSKIKNLYFCGGSVHPGGGIPLCLQSAKIVSSLV
ncbi:phytoene desaturase family protein [Mangrovivirga sp. M17]|uniref:Phytoene desaturase family protein n=1 Tax=Mangrovivirga halotolerans TaxID=2993936 RepID=A0ABT3RXX8_9BACT|nr:1-hydroxycarotenoid 3,4-desaturase CrtD [Mangrovivirga halotolerans]MCX2745990.1 phytoene desaturase family protein [Mangrovivirga halotolerans]